jgi:small GTP-binding protein
MSLDPSACKVVFLGESGTGKTSIISRYLDRDVSVTLSPTVGCAGRPISHSVGDKTVNLLIWDTAGQELYRSLTPIYCRNATAAVIVFDITVRDTYDQLSTWIADLRVIVEDIVLVVCGNKIDLEEERAVDAIDAAAFSIEAKAAYVETSAKTGAGIDQLFATVVRVVSDQRPDLIESLTPDRRTRKNCC